MIQKPHHLLTEARATDHVVCAFRVTSPDQVSDVLSAAAGPIAVSISGKTYARHPQIISQAIEGAHASKASVMVQLEQPENLAQALSVIETGVLSFVLSSNQFDFVADLHRRGAWVAAHLPTATLIKARAAIAAKVDGVVFSPPRTRGAFTGQEYIVFDRLDSLLNAIPQVAVCLQGITQVADVQLLKVSDSTIAELIFDVPKVAVSEFVVNKLAVLRAKHLVHSNH